MNQVLAYLGVYPIQYFLGNLKGYRVRRDTNRRARCPCPGEKAIKLRIYRKKQAKIGPRTTYPRGGISPAWISVSRRFWIRSNAREFRCRDE